MRNFLIYCLLLSASALFAQNTIGGSTQTVPEKEVTRQSNFVDAERELLLGHWDKAEERYKKFTYDFPDIDAAWYGLARAGMGKQDWNNAATAIATAVKLAPNNLWYRKLQADILEQSGRVKEALAVYQEIAKRPEATPDNFRHAAYLATLAGQPKEAIKWLDRLEEKSGISEETAEKKQTVYLAMGDVKKAAGELRKLADAFPARIEYRRDLAKFYETMGDYKAARTVYADILQRNPNDPVAKIAVLDKPQNGDQQGFVNALKQQFADPMVDIDAKLKQAMPLLSEAASRKDQAGLQALNELGLILEKAHPEDPKALSFSAATFYLSGQKSAALARYRQCIGINPGVFGSYENALSILEEQGNTEEMKRLSEQAMDYFPNQPKVYYYYALACLEQKQYDEAISNLDQAERMAVDAPIVLDILALNAYARLQKNDLKTAKTMLDKALERGGRQHPDVLERMGDYHLAAGDQNQARNFWQQAYDLNKKASILQKINH